MIIEQFPSTYQGIAQAGGPSSLTLDKFASVSPDAYKGLELYIASGAGAGQSRSVVSSRVNLAPNSNLTGTVGNATPDGWVVTGTGSPGSVLAQETVNGVLCQPYRFYNGSSAGIHGLQFSNTLVAGVEYQVKIAIRVPTGGVVDGSGCWSYLMTGYSPSSLTIATAAQMNAQPKDTWVVYSVFYTPTIVGTDWSWGMNSNTTASTFDACQIQVAASSTDIPYIVNPLTSSAVVGVVIDTPWTAMPDTGSVYMMGNLKLPMQDTIPAYPYQQYADDADIQAFFAAYNSLAQGYLDWYNSPFLGFTHQLPYRDHCLI